MSVDDQDFGGSEEQIEGHGALVAQSVARSGGHGGGGGEGAVVSDALVSEDYQMDCLIRNRNRLEKDLYITTSYGEFSNCKLYL